jgi:hypothetical protein
VTAAVNVIQMDLLMLLSVPPRQEIVRLLLGALSRRPHFGLLHKHMSVSIEKTSECEVEAHRIQQKQIRL